MKRILILLLVIVLMASSTACGSKKMLDKEMMGRESSDEITEESPINYKIGIITGTVVQGEEENETAQKMKEKYGDRIITATYPDNFSLVTEQTIATVTNMSSDPAVKVIVFVPAVPGTVAAIAEVKEMRDDILFISGVCAEDPAVVSFFSDICMQVNEKVMGEAVIDQAVEMGAKTFVHISFDRHLAYETVSVRQQAFAERCAEQGIEYVEAVSPDPTGEQGIQGAQEWITENVKEYVDQYGKDTAFFCTNCAMQSELIRQVAELGAIYPLQCCPSPYHAYPSAFDISIKGNEEDEEYLLEQIKEKVAEYGNTGRMATWEVPVNKMMIEAGVEYGIKWCEGEITERCDQKALMTELRNISGDGVAITSYLDEVSGKIDNYFLVDCPFYVF